jgi:hypothetical protein
MHTCSQHLIKAALECVPLVLRLLERHAKLKQRNDRIAKVLEEKVVILGIHLGVLPEALVLDQLHISGQHHERLGLDVLELLGAVPLLVSPLLVEQQLVVVVGHGGGREGPWAVEAGAISVAAAQSVRAGQSNHFLVAETHASENGADVAAVLGCVGETTIWCAEAEIAVGAAGAVGDLGTLHLLDGADAGEDPEVGVGDPWEGFLDGLEEVAGGLETGVCAVVTLGGEAHGCAVGATGVGQLVVAKSCQWLLGREANRHTHVPEACHANRTSTGP